MCVLGRHVPTVGGVILFGGDRSVHFPDAWIQAGRFGGTDKAKILDHTDITAPPVTAIQNAIAFVEKHMLRSAEIGQVFRKDQWSIPGTAVREGIINAVVHSDYSQRGAPIRVSIFDDRLEIENPGILPFGMTVEDMKQGVSKLRNRVIGRVFHKLRLIEQWGSGIQRISRACVDAGLRLPLFEEIGTRFRLTLYLGRAGSPQLDETDREILNSLDEKAGRSTHDLSLAIGLSSRSTRTRLAKLVDAGFVRDIGMGPNDPKRRYFRVRNF